MHFFDYRGGLGDMCATYFVCFLQYSRFGTDAAVRYATSLVLFIVIGTALCVYKWVDFDYKAKRQKYFSTDNNAFSMKFFASWDFRTRRRLDSKYAATSVCSSLGVMLFEATRAEQVKRRSMRDRV